MNYISAANERTIVKAVCGMLGEMKLSVDDDCQSNGYDELTSSALSIVERYIISVNVNLYIARIMKYNIRSDKDSQAICLFSSNICFPKLPLQSTKFDYKSEVASVSLAPIRNIMKLYNKVQDL